MTSPRSRPPCTGEGLSSAAASSSSFSKTTSGPSGPAAAEPPFDGRARGRAYALKPDFLERISLERRWLADGSRSSYSTRLSAVRRLSCQIRCVVSHIAHGEEHGGKLRQILGRGEQNAGRLAPFQPDRNSNQQVGKVREWGRVFSPNEKPLQLTGSWVH